MRLGGEKVSQRERKTDDPLAQLYIGEYIIREKGRCLGHAAGARAWTETPLLAGKCGQSLEVAFVAAYPQEFVFQTATLQVGLKLPVDMVGQEFALLGQMINQAR
jgi:hypothetical protein